MSASLLALLLASSVASARASSSSNPDAPTTFAVVSDWGGQATPPYSSTGQEAVAVALLAAGERNDYQFVLSAGNNFLPAGLPAEPATGPECAARFKGGWKQLYGGLAVPWYITGGYADWMGNASAERAFTTEPPAPGVLSWQYPALWHTINVDVPPNWGTLQIVMVDTVLLSGALFTDPGTVEIPAGTPPPSPDLAAGASGGGYVGAGAVGASGGGYVGESPVGASGGYVGGGILGSPPTELATGGYVSEGVVGPLPTAVGYVGEGVVGATPVAAGATGGYVGEGFVASPAAAGPTSGYMGEEVVGSSPAAVSARRRRRSLRDFNTATDAPAISMVQWTWLANFLNASTAQWLIVVGNDPVWSVGAHGPSWELVDMLLPLMNSAGVALYLSGRDPIAQHIKPSSQFPATDFVGVGFGSNANASQAADMPSLALIPPGSLSFAYGEQPGFVDVSMGVAADGIEQQMVVNFHNAAGELLYSFTKGNPRKKGTNAAPGKPQSPGIKGLDQTGATSVFLLLCVILCAGGGYFAHLANLPEEEKKASKVPPVVIAAAETAAKEATRVKGWVKDKGQAVAAAAAGLTEKVVGRVRGKGVNNMGAFRMAEKQPLMPKGGFPQHAL